MSSFEDIEDLNGIRLGWNAFPNSRIESTRMVVPISALYSPLKERPGVRAFPYEPTPCKSCRAILNPFCQVDFRGRIWSCPFCLSRNSLPPHYAEISPERLPAELLQGFTTMEYILNRPLAPPPVFLFVVDTCLEEDDLKALKDALIVSLSLLPQNALVGLVTFGTMAQIHELGFSECPKSYVFKGSKEYNGKQINEMLGFNVIAKPQRAGQPNVPPPVSGAARFLQPVAQCEFIMTSILEQLQRDPWPVANDKRPLRCTGTALSVAVGLLEAANILSGARIMLFSGGAATEGPGLVVNPELREPIRSHHDLEKDLAKHWKKASKVGL